MKALSREIKFRVYSTKMKEMIDWDVLKTKTDLGSVFSYEYESLIPMQYTGLHDKNGKEIYEGDLVKYCDYNTTDRVLKTAEVHWMCWADWANVPFLYPFGSPVGGTYEQDNRSVNIVYVTPPNDCEVIGNIYENPELLTKENE